MNANTRRWLQNEPDKKRRRVKPESPTATDYYAWSTHRETVGRHSFTVYNKPGMPNTGAADIAEVLLATHMEVTPDDTILVLNCGSSVTAMAAMLAPDGQVTVANTNIIAVEAAQRTLSANDLADNAKVIASSGSRSLPDRVTADVVVVRLPKGKQMTLQLLWDGFQALKPGGRCYLAGGNREGIKTYLRHMEKLFGNGGVRVYRKGHRVGVAVKEPVSPPTPAAFDEELLRHDAIHQFPVTVNNKTFVICSRPGVFSWDRFDAGSKALIDSMAIDPTDHVLDLGCGYGIVGIVAASIACDGDVQMVDADINAVESTRCTIEANGLSNCQVHLSDCAAAVRDRPFDVVVTNPPFHHGKSTQYDVAYQFIADAAAALKPGGRFYLVANRFIAYEPHIKERFGDVETVFEDGKFKVLAARQL